MDFFQVQAAGDVIQTRTRAGDIIKRKACSEAYWEVSQAREAVTADIIRMVTRSRADTSKDILRTDTRRTTVISRDTRKTDIRRTTVISRGIRRMDIHRMADR